MADDNTHEDGLALANEIFGSVQGLVHAIIKALTDGNVSTREAILLGLRGLPLVNQVIDVFDGTDPETRQDLLYVLGHGHWELDE